MKKLAILLVVVLILGGGGGAAWWFLLRDQPEGEEAQAAAEDERSLIPVARTIKLDPIVLPVIREGQVTLHISAVVVLDLSQATELRLLDDLSTPLRDSLLSALHSIYSIRYVQERGYNSPLVRQRLSQAAESVLGVGLVKGVWLQDITKRVPNNS
jgi:flagellar basal body-associated protein FliL